MKVIKDQLKGSVEVHYCSTHHNHEISLGHIRIAHETRMKIASQLQQGVTIERIMDNIRENTMEGITREHLVTKQDVHNVKNQYNIEGVMRHKNDLTSVCAWVEELRSYPNNPIILFKAQGVAQPDNMDNVGTDDFILGIQTQFQCDILCKYGNICICMDATHGTNMYDFKLITLLVLDDFGEGIPLAWEITNREDGAMLVEFLSAIKQRTGALKSPRWFMSDDAEQYYNSWKTVFGSEGTTKLLCAWHIDRSWRNALKEHIATKQTRLEIYHHLRTLLTENEESTFRLLLQQLLSYLDSNEHTFYSYFKATYCSRLEQWASCFRVGTVVNTNMFIESFHRVLKVVYLQHKQNRRIDYLLSTLLKIARDKVFDQLTKIQKGKYTHRVAEINKRHKAALHILPLVKITQRDEACWTVPSERDGSTHYTIHLCKQVCNCKLNCTNCHACVHMYTCTCMDATLHATVCKHVHLVKMITTMHTTNKNNDSPNSDKCNTDTLQYFSNLFEDTKLTDGKLSTLQLQIQHQIYELSTLLKTCQHTDALKACKQHLTSAITVMRAIENTDYKPAVLPQKRQYPPNKNSEKQLRFFSTKKRKMASTHLSKPSYSESQKCKSLLLGLDTTFCGICLQEDDHSKEDLVEWVQCNNCQMWLHMTCAKCENTMLDEYKCNFCSTL